MKMEDRIDDVDEMFEAFVKKKLKQLGMKRAATKNCDGTMNELEMNLKLRLEQNMNIGAENANQVTKGDETENKPKKSKKNKKEKKKRKKGKEADDVKPKKLKSRTDDKDAGDDVAIPGQNQTVNSEAGREPKINNIDESVKKEITCERSLSGISSTPGDQPTVNKQKTEFEATANEAMFGPVLPPPKKDIATIKMKVELLKAKSAKDETLNQAKKLLGSKSKPDAETIKTDQQSKEVKKRNRRASSSGSGTSRTRSKSRSRSRSYDRRRRHSHHRSRSRSRSRRNHHSRHRSKSPRRHHRRYRSRSRDRHHRKHRRDSPSRRKSRRNSSPIITKEDKVKLLEIAKANALAQHRANTTATSFSNESQILKQSAMSVKELTDICKDIAAGNSLSVHSIVEETKESAQKALADISVHHPFALKETPIAINIKTKFSTAPPIQSKPVAELSKEFPVSCGQQHRRKEVLEGVYGKWELVAKDQVIKKVVKDLVTTDKVFPDLQNVDLDISTVIAQRVTAARQLEENPNSDEAKSILRNAQQQLDDWTKSKLVLGQFTGSTALQPMPKQQLEGGRQAWFKQEEFNNAKHVAGIGKCLLQKMGWKPGMALGKTMPGQLEPLALTVKSDRKGLSSFMESPASSKSLQANDMPIAPKMTIKDLSGKHPVSVLMEICSKRRWQPPQFTLVDPLNNKLFQFKVIIVNDEYTGKPASNKKQAKLTAATAALQAMGLIPKT